MFRGIKNGIVVKIVFYFAGRFKKSMLVIIVFNFVSCLRKLGKPDRLMPMPNPCFTCIVMGDIQKC